MVGMGSFCSSFAVSELPVGGWQPTSLLFKAAELPYDFIRIYTYFIAFMLDFWFVRNKIGAIK